MQIALAEGSAIDMVFECTGVFLTRDKLAPYFTGAISAKKARPPVHRSHLACQSCSSGYAHTRSTPHNSTHASKHIAPYMASLELLECAGCGLLKVRQDVTWPPKLRCPAISVGSAALAHGTIVCGSCANQTRAGAAAVQLRATESRSAARHALQTCAPGKEQRRASWLKRQHVEVLQEEALLALEDSLGDDEADEEAEERKRKRWRPRSLKAPPNRPTAISRMEAMQLVQGVLPPGAAPSACISICISSASTCGCSMERPA